MYSELDKWTVIREMVKEKQFELNKYVKLLSMSYNEEKRFRQINTFIKRHFIPKDMKNIDSNWRDYLSSVDLLHLYSFMNKMLSYFYNIAPVHIEPKEMKGDIMIDYKFHPCGSSNDRSGEDLYNVVYGIYKNVDILHDKFFVLDGQNATIDFTGKPKGRLSVDVYDMDVRRGVLAELVDDAVARYEYSGNKKVEENLEARRKIFHFIPHRDYPEMGIKDVDYTETEEVEDRLISKMVGTDIYGNPVYESRDGFTNVAGDPLPDDTYIDRITWLR